MIEMIGTTPVTRRGRQRTPEPWLMAVVCRVGIHRGLWEYAAKRDCTQGRECARCGCVSVRSRHHREWQYLQDRSCLQIRNCERCNVPNGERTRHEWSESWEIDPGRWGSDREAHRCLRCGEVEEWTVSDGD